MTKTWLQDGDGEIEPLPIVFTRQVPLCQAVLAGHAGIAPEVWEAIGARDGVRGGARDDARLRSCQYA